MMMANLQGAGDNGGMYAEERRIKIIEMVTTTKKVTVAQLIKLFGVTGATIRADLRALEEAGALTRTHGGAIEVTKTGFESNMQQRQVEHQAEKQIIARTALSLIANGDTIVLDTGTTMQELARCLLNHSRLTVVTNDLLIAQILEKAEHVQTILLGGVVRKGFHCTINTDINGPAAKLTADKAFMGANSFSPLKGATTPDIQQAETKKSLIAMSGTTILLCDHSKLGRVSFAQFAKPQEIHTLVTDHMEPADQKQYAKLGIQVILPGHNRQRASEP